MAETKRALEVLKQSMVITEGAAKALRVLLDVDMVREAGMHSEEQRLVGDWVGNGPWMIRFTDDRQYFKADLYAFVTFMIRRGWYVRQIVVHLVPGSSRRVYSREVPYGIFYDKEVDTSRAVMRAWLAMRSGARPSSFARNAPRSAGAKTARALALVGAVCKLLQVMDMEGAPGGPGSFLETNSALRDVQPQLTLTVRIGGTGGRALQTWTMTRPVAVPTRAAPQPQQNKPPMFAPPGGKSAPGTMCPALSAYLRTHPRAFVQSVQLDSMDVFDDTVTSHTLYVYRDAKARNSKDRAMALLKQRRWDILEPALRSVHRPGGPIMRRQMGEFMAEQAGRLGTSPPRSASRSPTRAASRSPTRAASAVVEKRRFARLLAPFRRRR